MFKRLISYRAEKLKQELYGMMFDYRLKEIREKIKTHPKEVQIKFITQIQSIESEEIHEELKEWHRAICWS